MRNILGVKIDKIASKEVLDNIKSFLLSDSAHYIVTLNPEMVIEAQKNEYFRNVINDADLSIADGTGILLANRLLNNDSLPERISGADLMPDICGSDVVKNMKIYLLGAGEGIAKKTAEVLRNKYPHLNIVGAEEGIILKDQGSSIKDQNEINNSENNNISTQRTSDGKEDEALINRMNKFRPDILFVAFGAPKQEIWIHENIKKIPSIRLAIGVGGSFDFISGKMRRAPRILQKLGLEWLWRLAQEPKRSKRIYNATIKFGWMVLADKIRTK